MLSADGAFRSLCLAAAVVSASACSDAPDSVDQPDAAPPVDATLAFDPSPACANWLAECPDALEQLGLGTEPLCTEAATCAYDSYDDLCKQKLRATLECVQTLTAAGCSACNGMLEDLMASCPSIGTCQ